MLHPSLSGAVLMPQETLGAYPSCTKHKARVEELYHDRPERASVEAKPWKAYSAMESLVRTLPDVDEWCAECPSIPNRVHVELKHNNLQLLIATHPMWVASHYYQRCTVSSSRKGRLGRGLTLQP